MKKLIISITLCILAGLAFAQTNVPQVLNVEAEPSRGKVTITYDLVCDTNCDVSLMISNDGGATYNIIPHAVSGHIGSGIEPGDGKEIIWRPGADDMLVGTQYKAKVIAKDDLIYVPGGTFTMGSHEGVGELYEHPAHSVTLSPFYIGKYEVTQSEYQTIMESNPAYGAGVGDNYPVYYVNWYSAIKYCNLRSMREYLTPVYSIKESTPPYDYSTDPAKWGDVPVSPNANWNAAICNWNANGYRLPTEAEWEYAARGATNEPDYLYSGSDTIGDVAWYDGNSGGSTHAVGTKAPNGLGIYDMSGNVHEWCWDWSGNYSSDPASDPTGPTEIGEYRMLRGGVYLFGISYCRVAFRFWYLPEVVTYSSIGFRVCRAGL